MSCIHVDDVAGLALWAIENETIRGPLNAVMPQPVTNAAFTREVARAVHCPAVFPVPAFFLRLALGRMSSMLLGSSRVSPSVALQGRYAYCEENLSTALLSVARLPIRERPA
jgi:NAD dependent epimerase/dehydratase family enzyme